jgi:hypothetical protein
MGQQLFAKQLAVAPIDQLPCLLWSTNETPATYFIIDQADEVKVMYSSIDSCFVQYYCFRGCN